MILTVTFVICSLLCVSLVDAIEKVWGFSILGVEIWAFIILMF